MISLKRWGVALSIALLISGSTWSATHEPERRWQNTPVNSERSTESDEAPKDDGGNRGDDSTGCPRGLVCFTIEEWAKIDSFRRDLREEVMRLRSKANLRQSLSVGYLANADVQGINIDYEYRIWRFYVSGGVTDVDPYVRGGIRFVF